MDLLQIALIFIIVILTVFLSVLGMQVFFILRDLKNSLGKLDKFLGSLNVVEEKAVQPDKIVVVNSQTKNQKRFYRKILR